MHITLDLSDEEIRFIEGAVAEGRYDSATEVVREALSLLGRMSSAPEAYTGAELERMRAAYERGAASGDAGTIDFEAIKQEGRRRLAQR